MLANKESEKQNIIMIKELFRILLVEDNPGDVKLLRLALVGNQSVKFKLTCVTRLKDALEIIKEQPFDIILLDLSLPDAYGADTLTKLLPDTSMIPIIVLTGNNDESLALKAMKLGAQDYLIKGQWDSNLLVRTMRHAVERHNLLKDLEHQMTAFLNSEARFHSMIAHNADGVVIVDREGIVRFVNPAGEVMFARQADEIVGKRLGFPITKDGATEIEIHRPGHFYSKVTAEMRVVETNWDDEIAYLVSLRDITHRKQVECELRNYQDHLENLVNQRTEQLEEALADIVSAHDKMNAILQSVADGLIVTNLNYKVILANPAVEGLLGLSLDELLGKQVDIHDQHVWLSDLLQSVITYEINDSELDVKLEGLDQSGLKILQARTSLVDNQQGQTIGTVTIIRDVTRLREVDRLKTEFLTMAAHELRTPLTSILGFSEILADRQMDEDRRQRYMLMINEQASHLKEIINNILDISRLEAGRGLELNVEMVDIAGIINNVAVPFIETSPNHQFKIEGFEKVPCILGDPLRIKQVSKNLLSNAIKYSPKGGVITIGCQLNHNSIQLSFSDEGIGMTGEQQSHLFEQFYRADTSHTAVGGTGLGLTICKLIVDLHGGSIWVESQPNLGTTVHLTLPLAHAKIKVGEQEIV